MARIIFGGFQHETNTFAPAPADLAAFEAGGGWPGITRGDGIRAAVRGANIPLAGFLSAGEAAGDEMLSSIWAAASPSGPVTDEAFETIAGHMVASVRAALPVDGVYLDLHGAMVTQSHDDGEGELMRRLREVVGPEVPIVASLDLHANVTTQMLDVADALVAYRTYPHVDMADTGARAHALLHRRIAAGGRLAKAHARLPFLIPICWQSTHLEPAASLYRSLAGLEPGVVSASFTMGFPAADFPECSGVIWAYAPDQGQAQAAVDGLYAQVMAAEADFAGKLYAPDEAVAYAMAQSATAQKPIVIADAQDNPGAGSNADTTGMLRALLEGGARNAALGVLFDPQAAEMAHAAGKGARLELAVGGKSGHPQDQPYVATFLVEDIFDGQVQAQGPFYKGFHLRLGKTARLSRDGVKLVVVSAKVQTADRAMFSTFGIDPAAMDILVVKSAVHFRADFTPIAQEIIVAAAPGFMPMQIDSLPWKHLPPGLRLGPCGRPA